MTQEEYESEYSFLKEWAMLSSSRLTLLYVGEL